MGLIWSKYSCKKRIGKKINESEMKSRQDSFWHSILFAKRWSENHKKISKVFHVSVRNLEIRKNVSMMHLRNCNYAVQTIRIYQIWLRFGNGFSFEVNLWMVVWSKFNLFLTNKDFNATKKWNIKNDPKLKLNLFIFIDDIPSIQMDNNEQISNKSFEIYIK